MNYTLILFLYIPILLIQLLYISYELGGFFFSCCNLYNLSAH